MNGIFGPLKVNPIEKAEFEKTVDETLEMLNERDKERSKRISNTIDLFILKMANNGWL